VESSRGFEYDIPMRFPPSLLDEIRARLPVSQVVARKVALKRSGREMRGLSPFKQERTPSFFVNDQKGSWFDFSSGQNGDIFKFVMLTDGLSFPEAVERLAQEAGLPMAKPTAREAAQEDERERLYRLLHAASGFFQTELTKPVGLQARRYLEQRGLSREAVTRFCLGFAPSSKSALKEHLGRAGFSTADMVAAGMLIGGDDIPLPYDRFRNRVMFPITDLKGRAIAFGGRTLDPDAPAKYLNSPETPLFHKGSVLFNAANARGPAFDTQQIIVVEGYMDVIALAEAGFAHTVAPLGTALTHEQIKLLWRIVPEPTLCFDGDAAGRRAAFRAVEIVLPLLKPGFSVKFAFLPEDMDPDDLIRQQGPLAFQRVLERASPLFDVLMKREEQRDQPAFTPEQRASVDTRLKALVAQIADPSVRAQYDSELRETLWAKNRKMVREIARVSGRRPDRLAAKRRDNTQLDWRVAARARERSRLGAVPRAGAPAAARARSNELAERAIPLPAREVLMVRTLLNHPWLLEARCEEVAEISFTSAPLAKLRDALLALLAQHPPLERPEMRTQLVQGGLGGIVAMAERASTHKSDRFAEADADRVEVAAGWGDLLAVHEVQVGRPRALQEAERAFSSDPSEENLGRIAEAQQRRGRGPEVDSGDGVGD
jgi:DNA primase